MIQHYADADNLSRKEINYRRQVYPFALKSNMREIARPDVIRVCREACNEQIREHRASFFLDFTEFPRSAAIWLDPEYFHYPEHPFLVYL